MKAFLAFYESLKSSFEESFKNLIEQSSLKEAPPPFRRAVHYSLFAPAKRLRASLILEVGTIHKLDRKKSDLMASAMECLHTYSLVHDDLPSMDDDKFRRGQKSSHIKYDESTAILVGDSLQALSFELLAQAEPPYSVIADFAQAVGGAGMVGGQFMDLKQDNIKMNMGILNKINFLKTGRLFQMSVAMPLKFTDLHGENLYAYENWGKALGHLFQITDDLEEHKHKAKQEETKERRPLIEHSRSHFV